MYCQELREPYSNQATYLTTIQLSKIAWCYCVQTAFQEEQALLRQEALIAEEEAAQRAKSLRQARRAEADRERRAKKKVLPYVVNCDRS